MTQHYFAARFLRYRWWARSWQPPNWGFWGCPSGPRCCCYMSHASDCNLYLRKRKLYRVKLDQILPTIFLFLLIIFPGFLLLSSVILWLVRLFLLLKTLQLNSKIGNWKLLRFGMLDCWATLGNPNLVSLLTDCSEIAFWIY
jgi:hypothetical protein